MNFSIPCSTYVRLASVCNFFEPTTSAELKSQINCIRIQIVDKKLLAIVTNQKIACIEYVCEIDHPDGVTHLVVDPTLIEQCEKEQVFDSQLQVTVMPEIVLGTATTTMGFNYSGNACIFPDETVMDDWKSWSPDEPVTESKGFMHWNCDHLHTLVEASPSGQVYFPEHIDTEKPVVLRDLNNQFWVGLFMASRSPGAVEAECAAALPEWWG